jgi:alpha-glucosidase
MLLTLRGTPFIYYGEEIAMRDIPIRRKSDILDPIGKTFWPFYKGRDGCRAPMQWTSGKNAGFSDAQPWLPVHENYVERNVVNQAAEPDSVLLFFKALAALRKAEPALQRGDFKALTPDPHTFLAFERSLADDQLVVLLNFSSRADIASLPEGTWQAVFGSEGEFENQIELLPYQVIILKHT